MRQCVRQTFSERAKISVTPTKKGKKEIDENHPCYRLKWLKNKPVKDLVGPQYLHIYNVSDVNKTKADFGVVLLYRSCEIQRQFSFP